MSNFFHKLKSSIGELGVTNLVLYKFNLLLIKLFDGKVKIIKYYFFSQPVRKKPMVKHASKRKIKIKRICENSPVIQQFPRPTCVIRSRFNQGSLCYVATIDESFAGYIWFNEGTYVEDEVRCNFSPRPKGIAAWDYDVYISPENRLGLAFAMLWDRVNEDLSDKGFSWCTSRISAFNPNSISTHRKLGAAYSGTALFLCMGKSQLLLSSLPPFIHFSIKKTPTLKIPSPSQKATTALH